MASPPQHQQQQQQGPSGSDGPTPKPPQGSNASSSTTKSASPFHSISDNVPATGGGGGRGRAGSNNGKGPSPPSGELPPMPPRRGSRAQTPYAESRATAIFTSNVARAEGEQADAGDVGPTGLRRRRGAASASVEGANGGSRSVSPEGDSSSTGLGSRARSATPGSNSTAPANPTARASPGASLLSSLGRGVLGVSRFALGAAAGSLGTPFAWAEFMFAWVDDVTPPRLKRLARIFWDAGSHITKLAYTPAGAELGFAARNCVDGLVETIAAPKGRAVVLESGMTFVKFAEAVDTPEMHAAITQAFKLGQRGLDMLATDQAKDFLANSADFLSRLARLANAPETTLAVAEFVTVVCHALAQENAAYSRERVAQLSPFEVGGMEEGEEEEEDAGLRKPGAASAMSGRAASAMSGKGVRIVREDSQTGERLEWDEDLVLGRVKGAGGGVDESKTSTEGSTPRGEEGEEEEEEELDVSMSEGPSGRVGEEPDLLPLQEGAMESSISGFFAGAAAGGSVAEHARWEKEDKALLVKKLVESLVEEKRKAAEAGGVYTPAGAYKSERERAAHCALSFVFFVAYTVFALIGLRATLTTLSTFGGGSCPAPPK